MLVYGRNVAKEILESEKKIKNIFLQEKFNEKEIISLINSRNLKYQTLSKFEMQKKTNAVHQGIIIEVDDFKYKDLDRIYNLDSALVVILDHLEDPHNFGAIIRTCEAAKVDAIIIPEDRSVSVNPTVYHTSAGTVDKVDIIKVTNIAQAMRELKKYNYWIVATDMNGTDYRKIDYKGKTAIVIGNEGSGISEIVRKNSDFIASIPMKGTVNSLNASVAAGIVIFEALNIRG